MLNHSKYKLITLVARIFIFSIICYSITSFLSKKNSNVMPAESKANVVENKDRLQVAIDEKQLMLDTKLTKLGIEWNQLNVFIRAFKEAGELEVWGKNNTTEKYQKIQTYDFCETSGSLGPKRKSGDRQIPEGIYHINRFNEKSKFYLSLGLNYPNQSDLKRTSAINPGGDIFIHGDCLTIGCIPITDDKIKEVFLMAFQAKENGQVDIPVHIFPARLSTHKIKMLNNMLPEQRLFWEELKPVYDFFEETNQVPEVLVSASGAYELAP